MHSEDRAVGGHIDETPEPADVRGSRCPQVFRLAQVRFGEVERRYCSADDGLGATCLSTRQVNTMEFAFYVAYFPISLASFKTHSVGSELAPLDLRVAPSRIEPTKFSIQGKCKFSCGGIISDPSGCTS
jgi:hypothetical protein